MLNRKPKLTDQDITIIERAVNKSAERISDQIDREAGIPTESNAPRMADLLLAVQKRTTIIDNANDCDNYNTKKILKERKEFFL